MSAAHQLFRSRPISRRLYHALLGASRPLLRAGFPGRWKFIARFVNHPTFEPHWAGAPVRWMRGKVHGYLMPCDLGVFSGRSAYFMRRWYEADTQSLILSLLKPGDTFVDIGANVGMASLTAARAVGPKGQIVAFEPNPAVARIFAKTMAINRLSNVTLHVAAVGSKNGTARFFVPDDNHGEGSLGTDFGAREGSLTDVQVMGPTTIESLKRCELIKIDVEGWETQVVGALSRAIARHEPAIITEVESQHLVRCGSNVAELTNAFARLGYTGFRYGEVPAGRLRLKADLHPLADGGGCIAGNVLWVPAWRAAEVARVKIVAVAR